ncbi:MAG: type II and III secretion system protein family protein [Proteobacteria bacterium]|nr:type II and III secretion system protein family protein [Pseudomonadota bacterium]
MPCSFAEPFAPRRQPELAAVATTHEAPRRRRPAWARCQLLVAALALLLTETVASGAPPLVVPLQDSRTLPLSAGVAEISVSSADIADVKALGGGRLLVNGKRLGQTRITTVDRSGNVEHHLVQVVLPVNELAERLRAILPRQRIAVRAVGSSLALTGVVDDVLVSQRAERIVQAHLATLGLDRERASVLNFLSIRGKQQVQLRVKIAEVSRTALRQIGVNAWYRTADRTGGLMAPGTQLGAALAPDLGETGSGLQIGGGQSPGAGQLSPLPLLTPPFATDAFGLLFASQDSSSFPLSIALNLLRGKGMAKVLSEPTLVAFSGQKAEFLAGGEFPVPIPQGLGNTGIEFKRFGVQLSFTPTVLADHAMRLKVAVSVSERDQGSAVLIQGTSVPGLSTRLGETTVQLKNGQSFAIAGLLQDRIENSSSRVPLLGDLPVIGMLFRRNSFRRTETELVILVTANLVQPLKAGEVPPLPGEDEISDPGDVRFFLLGDIEVNKRIKLSGRGAAGPVGFNP